MPYMRCRQAGAAIPREEGEIVDEFTVRNWRKYQHYTDRNPPWIKLHFEILSSEDWVMLADDSRVLLIACMLIASRNQGKVLIIPSISGVCAT